MSFQPSQLNIAVDARLVFDEPWHGIAKTIVGLYRALAKKRPQWRFWMFHREVGGPQPFSDLANVVPKRIDIRGDRFNLWPAIRLPWAVRSVNASLFHAPAGIAPRYPMARLVATIHDLIPIETRPNDPDVRSWREKIHRSAQQACTILTASQHTRQRIIDECRVSPEKITVVHWGANPAIAGNLSHERRHELCEKYQIPAGKNYILHYGLADPRKNTARVIDAWSTLQNTGAVLLIVGVQDYAIEGFQTQIQNLGITESVRLHGYVPECDVHDLLAGAEILCYPTLNEGFGLPVLDAFAAEVPVLTSNTTSLPEVAGTAAELVAPEDPAAIAHGLRRLLNDQSWRNTLIFRGRNRVQELTWEKTAERVADVFERVANT